MSESKQAKDRTCKRCGAVLHCTARGMREHAATCARRAEVEKAFGVKAERADVLESR